MRALIADDEAPARAKLRRAIAASEGVELVGEAATGREAVAMIKRLTPDIVFLDIHMPALDGFGVVEAIAAEPAPYIVFVTANEEHAVRAFEVGAVDYLLKPYTAERFGRVVERARERFAPEMGKEKITEAGASGFLRRLLVSVNGRAQFISMATVDRLEADRNYVHLFTGNAEYRIRATIGVLERRLDPSQFLRVNRSTLVRFDAIKDMDEWSHGDYRITMHGGAQLTWSRRYRADARRRFAAKD